MLALFHHLLINSPSRRFFMADSHNVKHRSNPLWLGNFSATPPCQPARDPLEAIAEAVDCSDSTACPPHSTNLSRHGSFMEAQATYQLQGQSPVHPKHVLVCPVPLSQRTPFSSSQTTMPTRLVHRLRIDHFSLSLGLATVSRFSFPAHPFSAMVPKATYPLQATRRSASLYRTPAKTVHARRAEPFLLQFGMPHTLCFVNRAHRNAHNSLAYRSYIAA